jgi:AcrR family transcriptional regulator
MKDQTSNRTDKQTTKEPPSLDQSSRRERTEAKRGAIVDAAMRRFAQSGYQGAKVEEIAAELGIAKGSVFQHFGSKAGLFFASYKKAVEALPAWLDAPQSVLDEGFFSTVVYWLQRTEHLVHEDYIPYRVSLIGNYGTDLVLKRDINRFLVSEDPYGTLEFVEFGMRRGEVREGRVGGIPGSRPPSSDAILEARRRRVRSAWGLLRGVRTKSEPGVGWLTSRVPARKTRSRPSTHSRRSTRRWRRVTRGPPRASQTAAWPAELPPPTTATREPAQSWASGAPAA